MTDYPNVVNVPIAGSARFERDTAMAISRLKAALGPTGRPTFASTSLTELTASRLVATDADSTFASVSDLTSWIAGTANRVTVTDDSDGTITLSGPQDLHTAATPTFAGLILADGSTLGQAAGPLLTFDDTDNQLRINGCNVGINVAENNISDRLSVGGPVYIQPGTNTWGSLVNLQASVEAGGVDWLVFATTAAAGEGGGKLVFKDSANRMLLDGNGGLTLPAMSSAGFVKNTAAGLLSGGNALAASDIPFSTTVTGLTYTSATGVLSLTSGYIVPTTTEQTNWSAAYTHVSNNGTDHSYINQDVTTTASPTLAGLTLSGYFDLQRTVTTTAQLGISTILTTNQSSNIGYGITIRGRALNTGSGNITVALDALNGIVQQNGSGAITAARGLYGQIQNTHASGVITTGYTLAALNPYFNSTGTIGTLYGLYVAAQAHANVSTAYGVYQVGTSDVNYFGGSIGIGVVNPMLINEGRELALITTSSSSSNLDIGNNIATPADSLSVGGVNFLATGQSTHQRLALIAGSTDGGTSGQRGGRLTFQTKPDASTTITQRMAIDSSGTVSVGPSMLTNQIAEGPELNLTSDSSPNVLLNLTTSNPGDGIGVGAYNFYASGQNASHKRIAGMTCSTNGSTSGQRGGKITFNTKSDAGTGFTERMSIDSTGLVTVAGTCRANGGFNDNGSAGVDGTFTTVDGKTATVSGGIITGLV